VPEDAVQESRVLLLNPSVSVELETGGLTVPLEVHTAVFHPVRTPVVCQAPPSSVRTWRAPAPIVRSGAVQLERFEEKTSAEKPLEIPETPHSPPA
jgi:hypothetical protein